MEIAIVGGGPAGALAAARMAEAGRGVTLFHEELREEKPCGGGIPWRGLARAPFLVDPDLPRCIVSRLLLIAPSGLHAEVELDEPVHVFSRAALDGYLRRRAVEKGARLVPRRVVRIEAAGPDRAPARFVLTDAVGERHAVGRVAGADGVGSVVRRTFLGPLPRGSLTQTVGWYIRGRTDDRLIIRFEAGLCGYHWCFPRPDHLAVGVCAPLGSQPASALRGRCERFLESLPQGLAGEGAERVYYSALIPAPERDAGGRMRVEGDGWALLGDAAGAVDPLTREGIHYALETADLWAESVLDPHRGSYAERLHERFPDELARAADFAPRFFSPSFTERVVRYAERSKAVRTLVSDLVAGRQSYRTLGRRMAWCAVPLATATLRRRLGALGRRARAGEGMR